MVTIGHRTVPEPVVISVVFREYAGFTPMLMAASVGMIVLEHPVSKAILNETGLDLPAILAKQIMIPQSLVSLNLPI